MKFLDIVENGWASEQNPRRIGIYIRKKGRNFEMTDGKGDFWLMAGDNEKMRVIGNLLDKDIDSTEPYSEAEAVSALI
jgi:hypothetical protein